MQDSLSQPLIRSTDSHYYSVTARDIMSLFVPRVASNLLSTAGNAYLFSCFSSFSPQKNFSAAAALIFGVRFVLIVIPSGFFYAVPVLLRSSDKSPIVTTNGLSVAFLLGVAGGLLSLGSSSFFKNIIKIDASVCHIVQEYFNVFAIAFPFQLMTTVFNQIAPCVDARHLLYIDSVLNALCLFVFSHVFLAVYPLDFLSKTQIVAMSSLTSVISRFMVYLISYGLRNDIFEHFQSLVTAKRRDYFFSMVTNGAMICLQLGAELMGSFVLSILVPLMLSNEKVNLSILNVMNQFFIFSVVVPIALGVTAMIKIADLIKCGSDTALINHYVNVFLGLAIFYNLILFALTMVFSRTLAGFFMNPRDNEYTELSGSFKAMFAMTCMGILFDSFKSIINMSYRGLGYNQLAMEVSFTGVWLIGLPLAVLCSEYLGIAGMLLGFNIGNVFMGSCLLSYWFSKTSIADKPSLWRDCASCLYARELDTQSGKEPDQSVRIV